MRIRRPIASGLVAAWTLGALAACSLAQPSTPMVLENLTDTPLAVHVDGDWVGTYPASTTSSVPIRGEPPVGIEVVTPSGAVLVEWAFDAQQAVGGAVSVSEVPCGVIRLSVGAVEPPALGDLPPPSGPCP